MKLTGGGRPRSGRGRDDDGSTEAATLGDGPCLAAVLQSEPVLADAAMLATRWPLYYSELEHRTRSDPSSPFR